jgi:hypothetical protein
VNADVGVFLAVDSKPGGNLNIGIVEVAEFLFPILVFKLQEESAKHVRVVEIGVRKAVNVSRREVFSRLRRFLVPLTEAATAKTWATTPPWAEYWSTWATTINLNRQFFASRATLLGVQPTVAVVIEPGN